MPGYYLHFAACGGKSLMNRSFVLGVEAPDLLKKHVKVCGGIEGAHAKYDSLRTSDMPDYSELLPLIMKDGKNGLHFGPSSNPDVMACWSRLSDQQKANPFYKGYVWHLLTDALIYNRLNIDAKFKKVILKNAGDPNLQEIKMQERQKLHTDWDKTNALVRDTYPEITLPEEIQELGVVQFIEEEDLVYVDWHILKSTIEYLRTLDPLNGNMDSIIHDVLSNI